MLKRRATIVDVAERAGVSWKTVSRVINREPNVRSSTVERVEAAVLELGFRPNSAARSLAGTKSFLIGAIADNPSPHYLTMLHWGAVDACRKIGHHLALEEVSLDAPDFAASFESSLISARFDGVILSPPTTDSPVLLDLLEKHNVPFVRLNPMTDPERSDRIITDDGAGVEQMVEHLWEMGHRSFAIVNGPDSHKASHLRKATFLRALREKGYDSDQVIQLDGDFGFRSGFDRGTDLLSATEHPTAVFAANDEMAAGVVAAASRLNLKIPDELAVTGFDDSDIAQMIWPPLTTVSQPIAESAKLAVEMLTTGKCAEPPHRTIQLAVELIVRQSTKMH